MREERVRAVLCAIGVAFMLQFALAPIVYMAVVSLARSPELIFSPGDTGATIVNYVRILTDPSLHFLHYLRNSIVVAGASSLLAVFAAVPAAYAITRLPLPGKVVIVLSVLSISMFPQVSAIGYLFKLMAGLGWINTHASLVLPYAAWILPLTLWILVSYLSRIPRELDSAALVDGCTRWKVLFRVILPVAAPGILSAALLAFIFAFNEFLFALMLTTDFRARTVPVGIALFQGLHGQLPWGTVMAASVISTIPVIILAMIFQRRIISGLTGGAVKG
ncbi:MAG: ABC transporter permease subunit [Deltaproteobacteria bacterium]|nr:ABC transporter permease subunit [Deltaproteobacteria bacterium]NIS77657.1 ABC transporter permease subunit [Deltaproteobacteria bacterium]